MALFHRIRTSLAPAVPEDEAPVPGGLGSAGELLRQQRLALGLDLGEVSAALRIKTTYLAALEDGRPDRLPGPAYAIGFLRAYSEHLGLDGGEIVRRFRREAAGLDTKPDLSFPMPLDERGIPSRATLLAALVLTILGYGTWYYLSSDELKRPERVTEVPADLLPPKVLPATPAEATAAAATPADATAGAGHANPATGGPAATATAARPSPGTDAVAHPGLTPAGIASTSESPTPAPLAPPANSAPVDASAGSPARIVLQATADSWVELRDRNHAILFTGVLKAGQRYSVPDRPGISMRTGNAGGLEIIVDGKPQPSLGPAGAVRSLALDPQSLTAGSISP
ncbi:MAG TPA: RodZ domain-containing protein [Stellaceae bacterium]|nr:RodZ domain-containing protein [Stellaceae bacterium]